jgi:hypothetical protein
MIPTISYSSALKLTAVEGLEPTEADPQVTHLKDGQLDPTSGLRLTP